MLSKKLDTEAIIPEFDGTTIVFSNKKELDDIDIRLNVDFFVNYQAGLGSVLLVIGAENESYISEIQHVRRRETIAMTPANTLIVLEGMLGKKVVSQYKMMLINLRSCQKSKKLQILRFYLLWHLADCLFNMPL